MEKPLVEVETTIDADVDTVWQSMTQRKSPMFMGATMETDWQPGSSYTLSGDWGGKPFTDYGTIETVEEGRELAFTHWANTPEPPDSYNAVRYTLAPEGEGTRVTLGQYPRGEATTFDDKTRAEFRKNWQMMLDGLKTAIEGSA